MKKILSFLLLLCSLSAFSQADRDAFGWLRVSTPVGRHDAQFTYDLQPLLYDTIKLGDSLDIEYDTINRCAKLKLVNSLGGDTVAMQSFEFFRYQPGKSQLVYITFNFIEAVDSVVKFVGYSDGENGIEFILDGTTPKMRLLSNTDNGDQVVEQKQWNIDRLSGRGKSKLTLDVTKTQILVIDFEALYVGKVRVGFNINGETIYVHEFEHANKAAYPYIQTANLPIRVGMYSEGAATTNMYFVCSAVSSEGGISDNNGYSFSSYATATAGNGTNVHLLSIEPRDSFGGIINRAKIVPVDIEVTVTGANPVRWSLVAGQSLTGESKAYVDSTYSSTYVTSGTLDGDPEIVLMEGFVAASASSKTSSSKSLSLKIPITLDYAGNPRTLGRLTLRAQGIGGTSATHAIINFTEIR